MYASISDMVAQTEKLETNTSPPQGELPKWYDIDELQEAPLPEFKALRGQVLTDQRTELLGRMATDPTPDADEAAAGILKEHLEPQCREAVLKMRRKGHQTLNSGFGVGNVQVLDGILDGIDTESAEQMMDNGFLVYETEPGLVSVAFRPETADLEAMTEQWNKLADLMPDLGHQAEVSAEDRDRFFESFQQPGQYGYDLAMRIEH